MSSQREDVAAPTLSLIVPTCNQRGRAVRAAHVASAYLAKRFPDVAELILVDDGSRAREVPDPDELPGMVQLVRLEKNLGKGGAVRAGVARASGEFVIFTDSDLPFSLDPVPRTLELLRGADIVIADRHHSDSVADLRTPPLRRLSSTIYTQLVNVLLGLDYLDTQAGYKGYRGSVAKELFGRLRITGFAFDAELLLRAHAAGYGVVRQPVTLLNDEDSSVRLWRHGPLVLRDTLRLVWWRLTGGLSNP